jgi:magnesium-protoporphyrin O-methyltransferase
MAGCCSAFGLVAERQFDGKKAAKELARYRAKGPGRTTRLLEATIARAGPPPGLLLDVGAGIGSLTFGLLDRGLGRAIAVDASPAYVAAAKEEARRRNLGSTAEFIEGDFVALAPDLPSATVVTLDRVVCCYPSFEPLLVAALGHAEHCVALSYPRDAWHVRGAVAAENTGRRLKGNPFRMFVHPAAAIERLVRQAGFELSGRRETWMWRVDAYVRR